MATVQSHRLIKPKDPAQEKIVPGLLFSIESYPLPSALYAPGGELIDANQAFRQVFSVFDSIDTLQSFQSELEPLKGSDQGDEIFAKKCGRWFSLHRSNIAQGLLIVAIDISERIEALSVRRSQHDTLLTTSRLLSVAEMAATLAHELNQPLAGAINYLAICERLLQQSDVSLERLAKGIKLAKDQASHAAAVVSRIREFIRSREPSREQISLSVMIHAVVGLLELEIQRDRIGLTIDIPDTLPLLYVDRVMLEQVLLNLLKNAIEALRDVKHKRKVHISARLDLDEMVEINVTDNGPGVDPQHQQKLFSAFFTSKANGLGIGLAICRSIMEYHGGNLWYAGNKDGAQFLLTAPPVHESPCND